MGIGIPHLKHSHDGHSCMFSWDLTCKDIFSWNLVWRPQKSVEFYVNLLSNENGRILSRCVLLLACLHAEQTHADLQSVPCSLGQSINHYRKNAFQIETRPTPSVWFKTVENLLSHHSFSVFCNLFALLASSHTVANQNQGVLFAKYFPNRCQCGHWWETVA